MSVDAQAEVVIARPRAEVAALMFDAKQDKLWLTDVKEVYLLTPGTLKKDSRIQRIGLLLNRHYDANILITRDEPEKMLEMAYNEPFEFKLRYDLSDMEDGGTKVKLRVQSAGETPYNMPASALTKAIQEKLANELKRLKNHLENNS